MDLRSDDRLVKLHKEDLHKLYSSPNIIRAIKSKGIKWIMVLM
jgi:hypothetical protein